MDQLSKRTTKAGYGVLIQYPDGNTNELYDTCGEKCTHYEAEMVTIESAFYHLSTIFDICTSKDLRAVLLHLRPNADKTFYSTTQQLKKICTYHSMTLDKITKARMSLDQ
ncbi:hypothetical protein ElyMa_005413100 [Elysia marginata]|uniref:Uncharacterized protein n=1 Tax=Elysia marginata TaxID=1093978 RepID=A0AAV4EHY3_9GAST|nr:hypothetical protein ElyMa_005413100 [Elysia marginata]